MELKFVFSNHDNAANPLVIQVNEDTTIESIRQRVFSAWPNAISKPARVVDVRMFCMGKALDGPNIAACALPVFDFPTPVHVVGKLSPKAIAAERKAEGGSCCVVM